MSSGYPEFRRKLDAVLRQRDPQALRAFLVGEGQWDTNTTTDPERAMWMMIATSPALAALRDEAIAWLAAHGYAEEARTLGRGGSGGHHPPPPSPHRGGGGGPRPPARSGGAARGPGSSRPHQPRRNGGPESGHQRPPGTTPKPRG